MGSGKYSRSISMQCPTCGGADFKQDDSPIVQCATCERQMTKDELREANSVRIEAEVDDVKAQIMKDFRTHLAKAFKKWK